MNDHDRDLILELIEGHLSERDASAALSRVASDPEFAAEYHAQIAVRDTLAGLDPVTMTATERQGLRASLTKQLNIASDAAPRTNASQRHRAFAGKRWFAPLAGLAAAMAAVAVFVVLPSSSNDSASDITALESAEAPTAPLSDAADGGAIEGQDSVEFAAAEPMVVVDLTDATAEDLLDLAKGRSQPGDIESRLEVAGYAGDLTINQNDLQRCLDVITPELPAGTETAHLLGAGTIDDITTVYLGLTAQSESVDTIVSLRLADCSFTTTTSGLDVIED